MGAAEPKLASGPLVLSTRDSRRGLIVAAVNLAGRQAGVRPAMRLSEAAALVEAEIRVYDPHEDLDTLCGLAEQMQQFSPLVGLEQLDKKLWAGRTLPQPECVLLDISGIPNLFGGEVAMLEQVCGWLSQQNYFGCLGLAGNIGAAWALANYATRCRTDSIHVTQCPTPEKQRKQTLNPASLPLGAEAPTSSETGENSTAAEEPIVPSCRYCRAEPGDDQAAIGSLPLTALRLDVQTIESLRRLGIDKVAQLSQLPRSGLATRLGETLLMRWDQAAGRKTEPLVALHSLPDWQVEQALEFPTEHSQTMIELVRRLSVELALRLSRRGEGALRIVCRLDLVESQPLIMQLGLFRPTNDVAHLQWLLSGQLEQHLKFDLLRSRQRPVMWRVSLQATLTAPLVWRQIDLFESDELVNRHQIARLVDTLSSRLGRKQVLNAKIQRDAQPELGFILHPMTGRRPDGKEQDTVRKLSSRISRQTAEPAPEDPQRRPTHLFSPPVEISVVDHSLDPVSGNSQSLTAGLLSSQPSRFCYQQRWFDIVQCTGPERLESGWWRGPSARRDYYRAVTQHGSWYWIYRDLHSHKWYLHGIFD